MRRNAEDGFRMLMKKYKVPVYWHTRRLLVSHDDAQDATQETLIRVFHSFDRFKGDCPLGAWTDKRHMQQRHDCRHTRLHPAPHPQARST